MEKAEEYGAHFVFFESGRNGRPPVAQAFVYVSAGPADDPTFAELHKRLWSWGGVPLIYRKTAGLIQLFRCAHKPDFVDKGKIVCKPIRTLRIAAAISSSEAWWDASRLRNGTIWDDTAVCKAMLSASKSAHKGLIDAVIGLNDDLNSDDDLNTEGILKERLRRRLLILSLLIAYLEERGVFLPGFFEQFLPGATKFFRVLANGDALIKLLIALEDRFNGHVFIINDADRESLKSSSQLARFARLIEGRTRRGRSTDALAALFLQGSARRAHQPHLSDLCKGRQLHLYASICGPPDAGRGAELGAARPPASANEIILDPSCGSGVFLVEAYKRLVLHWRSRNEWKRPDIPVLSRLLNKVHGIDLEPGAVELAAFSLCLALAMRWNPRRFVPASGFSLRSRGRQYMNPVFSRRRSRGLVSEPVGVVVGNPPFGSSLDTPGAEQLSAIPGHPRSLPGQAGSLSLPSRSDDDGC